MGDRKKVCFFILHVTLLIGFFFTLQTAVLGLKKPGCLGWRIEGAENFERYCRMLVSCLLSLDYYNCSLCVQSWSPSIHSPPRCRSFGENLSPFQTLCALGGLFLPVYPTNHSSLCSAPPTYGFLYLKYSLPTLHHKAPGCLSHFPWCPPWPPVWERHFSDVLSSDPYLHPSQP